MITLRCDYLSSDEGRWIDPVTGQGLFDCAAARKQAAYLEEISGENGVASTLTIFPAKKKKDQEVVRSYPS